MSIKTGVAMKGLHSMSGFDYYNYATNAGVEEMIDDDIRHACKLGGIALDFFIAEQSEYLQAHHILECVNSGNIDKLVLGGININMQDYAGDTALHLALNIYAIEQLLEVGADPTILNKAGYSFNQSIDSCFIASNVSHGSVERMITYGFDLNARDANGRAALHLLVDGLYFHGPSKGKAVTRIEKMEALLMAGVDCNPLDNEGQTPIDYLLAEEKRMKEMGWDSEIDAVVERRLLIEDFLLKSKLTQSVVEENEVRSVAKRRM